MLTQTLSPPAFEDTCPWFKGVLEDHQRAGLEWLLSTPRALLADDVGLGKTIQVLAMLAHLRQDDAPILRTPVLWLTDASLVDQTCAEVGRFLPGFTVLASTDPDYRDTQKAAKSRAQRFTDGLPDILVANYQQTFAKRSLLQWDAFSRPGVVILDEAMTLKGGDKMHAATRGLTERAERVVAMTATPLENHAYETYMILYLLRPKGLWPRAVFEDEFIEWDRYPGQAPKPVDLWPHRMDEFRRYLSGVMLRRTVAELGLPLPVRVGESYRRVPLSRAQRREWTHARGRRGRRIESIREEIALSVRGISSLQDACMAKIVQHPSEKIVVYCERIKMLDELAVRLEAQGLGHRLIRGESSEEERTEALRAFRADPAVRVLVGSRVIERGLNLQHARILISLVQSYNPAREHQREGRIRRLGSPHATYEHLVLEPDVPDAGRRQQILDTKQGRASAVLQ